MKLNVTIDEKQALIPMRDTKVGDIFVFDLWGETIVGLRVFGGRVVALNTPNRTWCSVHGNNLPVRLLPSGSKVTIEVS
jgi:hypothetical protein